MPSVNWELFRGLAGSVEKNFEMLCRALIRRHYGQYGAFAARASQPGVEFHLRLDAPCILGKSGEWFGWQCKWYDALDSGRAIGTSRKNKIEEAIRVTERELPELTHWILWTRYALTKGDQAWFYAIKTKMKLELWTALEAEEHLSGNAEILRSTYFGELILMPDALSTLHKRAVAPIKARWHPDLHQITEAEREVRRALGEMEEWREFDITARSINANASNIDSEIASLPGMLVKDTVELINHAQRVSRFLIDTRSALEKGDLDALQDILNEAPELPSKNLLYVPRRLRAAGNRASLHAANLLSDLRIARRLSNAMTDLLGRGVIALVADAGCGKTQFSAQLTSLSDERPAGILLLGRDLHAGDNLDRLVRSVVIGGKPVESMEALIASVDAAGQRAGRRLPVVIDGLNEAEDPRDWKGGLATLSEVLKEYPYVLAVCTLRSSFRAETLPEGMSGIECSGFADNTGDAIEKYFKHYKISLADVELPWRLLQHPLTLRLFCEVANPEGKQIVGGEAVPKSLTALFDKYLEQASLRIAELAPKSHRYFQMDVLTALTAIGRSLWETGARTLGLGALRTMLGDAHRPWNESIVRALEHEGVLISESLEKRP